MLYVEIHLVVLIGISISSEDLYNAEQGVAYLWKDDATRFPKALSFDRNHRLELIRFEYDDLEFEYSSNEKEFLVIADSWHPNWKARVNGENIPIIKTNGVFKGILLPPGEGTVNLFFDNTPYWTGVWVSIASWVIFLFSWAGCSLRLREKY
jgi:uncharacterized membrane protein YfhO